MAGTIRRTIWFDGRVQGVGFRYTAVHVAQSFAVTGYVRNLPDGRVELVAEGELGVVDRLEAAVRDAMRGYVRGVEHLDAAATGEFDDFGVRD